MGVCPKCNFKVADDAAVCENCGEDLARTVDLTDHSDEGVSDTVDLSLPPGAQIPSDANSADDQPANEPAQVDATISDAGNSTVDFAPGMEANNADEPNATVDLPQSPVSSDDQATLVTNPTEGTPAPDAGQKTVEFSGSGDLTIDANEGSFSADSATVDLDPGTLEIEDGVSAESATLDIAPPAAGGENSDKIETVVLDNSRKQRGDQTINYETVDTEQATHLSGSLGTEGRLNRLWGDVAGSSENPMHSLQGIGQQASDTVFERVATRRVADAQITADSTADYQIVDKLGEGAMGIVFSARQTAVDRIVAFKTAKPNYQKNDESRRRFLYEAHITADLDHSNIVPIHELGASEEGMLFYSMKLVQGTEWSRVIRKKTREENVEIFMKVADAIAFAHSKGVIHRDLKPENTMLGRFGEVFVTDWGTAINIDKDSSGLALPVTKGDKFLTVVNGSGFAKGDALVIHDGEKSYDRLQIHMVDEANPNRFYFRKKLSRDFQPDNRLRVLRVMNLAGTPCYMAPEMAGHQLAKIGRTSDIYVLGAILYDIVTGKAPHTGQSVTQCLKAALQNEVIEEDHDDPLLTIAYKAMASEPKDRYQSVEELQDAVREYRRHAESIALCERSDELLGEAVKRGDYETFSRTLFGYRDAIDLWPKNQAAQSGLERARLAFGQAAFDKGDYDLVIQTVDKRVAEEAELYEKAVEAKRLTEGREAKLRVLQRAVAAIVLIAVVGLSGLSIYAFQQSAKATLAADNEKVEREKAERLAAEKEELADLEAEAKIAALEAKQRAEEAAANEKSAKDEALLAKQTAEESAASEKRAKEDALLAKQAAEMAAQRELVAKNAAVEAANLAKRRAAQIQLGEYNSSLALAKSQIDSFDIAAGRQILERLKGLSSEVFFGANPDFDTWGWKRINLLSNADLPYANVGQQVAAIAYATNSHTAVTGGNDGSVQLLRMGAQGLELGAELQEQGAQIVAVAIAPNGQEVVYAFHRDGAYGLKRWRTSSDIAEPVEAVGNRQFQHLAYTADGSHFIAGINGGIWIWKQAPNWHQQPAPSERVADLRGELKNVQSMSGNDVLLTTQFRGKLLLAVLNTEQATAQLVEMPSEISDLVRSAVYGSRASAPSTSVPSSQTSTGDILLGLDDNRFVVGRLSADLRTVSELTELDTKHKAPISQVTSSGNGQVITASDDEPVAHVWKHVDDQWHYETFLNGTPKNIVSVGFLGDDQVLGIDSSGTSIVWNVQRQKQRRRLQRSTESGEAKYNAPIQGVFAGDSNGNALAIDENGVVDLWNLTNGSTQFVNSERWSYIGHTPGATFVDSAIDLNQGIVITAANLRNAEKKYLKDDHHNWEFCLWNADTAEMIRRWSTPNRRVAQNREESIEQRISLLDSGRVVLFASDNETRLIELASGKDEFLNQEFGTYFAVSNPANPKLIVLVKRSGALRLLDLDDPNGTWQSPGHRNFRLADPSDTPLQGIWSQDGERFYLGFSAGNVAAFEWNGQDLKLTWSSRRLEATDPLRTALNTRGGRITSHLDLDLEINSDSASEVLHLVSRNRGQQPTTRHVGLQFDGRRLDDQQVNPALVHEQSNQGIQWLRHNQAGEPRLSDRVHDLLLVESRRVREHVRVNNHTFVSTSAAQVLELTDGRPTTRSFGRSKLVSATGNREGSMLYALLADGAVWQFQLGPEAQGLWQRLDYELPDATRIELSPDATRLYVQRPGDGEVRLANTGEVVNTQPAAITASWAPSEEATLAIANDDGSIELQVGDQPPQALEGAPENLPGKIVNLTFFTETWDAGGSQRHLLVHIENEQSGYLQFVPLDPLPEGAVQFRDDADFEPTQVPLGTLVTASPTEGILVTGTPSGTVSVWFATPTWERNPRQLFDLEGHRGAKITCLSFSSDGQTIVSADDKHRLFAWLSSDPLIKGE